MNKPTKNILNHYLSSLVIKSKTITLLIAIATATITATASAGNTHYFSGIMRVKNNTAFTLTYQGFKPVIHKKRGLPQGTFSQGEKITFGSFEIQSGETAYIGKGTSRGLKAEGSLRFSLNHTAQSFSLHYRFGKTTEMTNDSHKDSWVEITESDSGNLHTSFIQPDKEKTCTTKVPAISITRRDFETDCTVEISLSEAGLIHLVYPADSKEEL